MESCIVSSYSNGNDSKSYISCQKCFNFFILRIPSFFSGSRKVDEPFLSVPLRFSIVIGFKTFPRSEDYIINASDSNGKLIIGLRADSDFILDYISKNGLLSTFRFNTNLPKDENIRLILSVNQKHISLVANCKILSVKKTPNDFPARMHIGGLVSIGSVQPDGNKVSRFLY